MSQEVSVKKSHSPPLFEVNHVSKSYSLKEKGSFFALKDVSFSVFPGTILGIMGKSGAGKSTLLRCLNFLEVPDKGDVLFKGKNLKTCSFEELREIRRHIGMIFQGFQLLSSRNVLENVMLPLEIGGIPLEKARSRAQECLEWVGLEGKLTAYPSHLSGGQKQRVAIARALALDTQVLLCDEITSALDPETTEEILTLLRHLNKKLGLTIIMITHEISVIRHLCDQVCVMHHAKLVEEGPVEEVFLNPSHEITKSFVQSLFTLKIPHLLQEKLSPYPLPTSQQKVLRLVFPGKAASQPILSDFIKKYPASINIISGHMDRMGGSSFGILMISLPLSHTEEEQALSPFEFLKEHQVHVETLGYLS